MKILLLGASGQVGAELTMQAQALGTVTATVRNPTTDMPHQLRVDLADLGRVRQILREQTPELIINAAAYTAVDQAEDDSAKAHQLNAELPKVLAEYTAQSDNTLVHYSTDYVFDGDASVPYLEADLTSPLGTYGSSKLAGERAIITSGCRHLIFRTSWVYGSRGKNFLLTILKLAAERDELSIVDDQIGTPTYAASLAALTISALAHLREGPWPSPSLFHLSSRGQVSWFGFADYFLQRATDLGLLPHKPKLIPVSSDRFPSKATRPKWSVLDNAYFEATFDLEVPHWRQQVDRCLDSIAMNKNL